MTPLLSANELASRDAAGHEYAVIDPREAAIFGRGHLFKATNLPLADLEDRIADLVPRLHTEVVLTDDLDGTADRAADVLSALGYTDLKMLAGGIAAWHAESLGLFTGYDLHGKAFGEHLMVTEQTPWISADELAELCETQPNDVVILDGRTRAEHEAGHVPGAVHCSNGDLAEHFHRIVPNPETIVVAHCGGRTRAIVATHTLRMLGVPNRIHALEDGTVAWTDSGRQLQIGIDATVGGRQPDSLAATTRRLGSTYGVTEASPEQLRRWRADSERTTYFIDVDTEISSAGTAKGFFRVAGGQLLQGLDRVLCVRTARVVIASRFETPAWLVAVWLRRIGWADVSVTSLPNVFAGLPHDTSPASSTTESTRDIADVLHKQRDGTATIVDARSSREFRAGHIPDSYFLTRRHLAIDAQRLPGNTELVLVGPKQRTSRMATDLAAMGRKVSTCPTGINDYIETGGQLRAGFENMASSPTDCYLDPTEFDSEATVAFENRLGFRQISDLLDVPVNESAAPFLHASPSSSRA